MNKAKPLCDAQFTITTVHLYEITLPAVILNPSQHNVIIIILNGFLKLSQIRLNVILYNIKLNRSPTFLAPISLSSVYNCDFIKEQHLATKQDLIKNL